MTSKQGLIRPYESGVTLIQRLLDSFWIVAANVLANLMYGDRWDSNDTLATAVAVILFGFAAEAGHLYRGWRAEPYRSEISKVWGTWLLAAMGLLFLAFTTKVSAEYSRGAALLWLVLAPTVVSASRVGVRYTLRNIRAQGRNLRTVAIVGATDMGAMLAERIARLPWMGMRVVGFYDDRRPERLRGFPSDEAHRLRGNLRNLVDDARSGRVDRVYIALPLRAERRIQDVCHELADTTVTVHVLADLFVFDLLNSRWANVDGLPVVSVFESPFYGVDGWLKRIEDLLIGTVILAIVAIPMLIIAIGVKLTSAGPVFFRQRRCGLNGEEIRVLKFRSMTVCEDGDQVKQATANDARITPFGAFLRRTSLDELPQFFHVITGKMSIVGPRPHALAHNEQYRRLIHGYMLRHRVKPGITGWAQVNGWRGETETLEKMEKRVEHDLEYIRNWRLGLDLKIIFLTVFGRAAHRNAF